MQLPLPSSCSSSGCHQSPGWQLWAHRRRGDLEEANIRAVVIANSVHADTKGGSRAEETD